MPLTRNEAERVIAEGGSVLIPGRNLMEDVGPVTSVADLPDDFEYGDQVSLDSPDHPKNIAIARQQLIDATGLPDPADDAEYQDYLRFKSMQQRSGGVELNVLPLGEPSETGEESSEEDDEDSNEEDDSTGEEDETPPNPGESPKRRGRRPALPETPPTE